MTTKTLEQLDAYIQVAVLGAYADGELAEEERRVLRDCIRRHASDPEQARIMIEFAERLPEHQPPMNAEWRAVRLGHIRNALPDRADRKNAFALAVRVANAHSGVGVRESRLLLQLVSELSIEGQDAWDLVKRARAASQEGLSPATPAFDRTLVSVKA